MTVLVTTCEGAKDDNEGNNGGGNGGGSGGGSVV